MTDSPLSTENPLVQVLPAVSVVVAMLAPTIVRFLPPVSRHSVHVPAATLIVSPLEAVAMAAPTAVNGPEELTTSVDARGASVLSGEPRLCRSGRPCSERLRHDAAAGCARPVEEGSTGSGAERRAGG